MALSRRQFLLGAAGVAALAACSDDDGDDGSAEGAAGETTTTESATTTTPPAPELSGPPFTLGVASGDPDASSVVLWTRLAPEPTAGGGMPAEDVPVEWEVAADEAFEDVVASGVATAEPGFGHSVHVVVDGLEAGTEYRYRFHVGEHTSPTGRARTAPDGEAETVRFAFGSCQNWQAGFWSAHEHLAEEDLDLVLWLGDYIYEGGADPDALRQHDGPEPTTIEGYRNRYGLYKGDPALQAAHAARPWLVVWDDHEVENNYASDSPQDGGPPEPFLERRAAAYQAWWEHMPVRMEPPDGPALDINRVVQWGDLLSVFALDTRQFRANQPCGGDSDLGPGCPEQEDPNRPMLGAEQESWLADEMSGSTATWNVLANQVIFSPSPITVGTTTVFNLDQWDGYPAARSRVLDILGETSNTVIITGDIHASAVGEVRRGDEIVAVELVGTSISSTFPEEFIALFEGAAQTGGAKMADARHRGYVRCTATPASLTAEYRVVESTAVPSSPVSTASTWVIDAGTPGVRAG
jgi:alkaline phosphatase D